MHTKARLILREVAVVAPLQQQNLVNFIASGVYVTCRLSREIIIII